MVRAPSAGYDPPVPGLTTAAAYGALGWAGFLAWLAIGAVWRRWQLQRRFASARAAPATEHDAHLAGLRVLIMRPCAGVDHDLLANLLSVAQVDSRTQWRVVMTVDDPADLARPVILEAIAKLRAMGVDAHTFIPPQTGPNRKASMLAAIMASEQGREAEVLINVDSNVDLRGYDLDGLIAPLLGPRRGEGRVGASWAPWSERRTQAGVGPRASEAVLGGSLAAFPLLCGIDPGGLVGKLWAVRREALDAVGDFDELTHYLGEDFEMARRLRAAGWSIAVAPVLARARGGDPPFRAVVGRFARWMLVVRGQRPLLLATYPLLFFATPLILALAAVGALAQPTLAGLAVALAVFARASITISARRWSGRGEGLAGALAWIRDALLSDLVLALAWVRALSSRTIDWRGHLLRVDREGRLHALEK